MIRKLVSSLLCAFALLLLMGAGTASRADHVHLGRGGERSPFRFRTDD